MKKFVKSICLALGLTIALAGCTGTGNGEHPSGGKPNVDPPPVTQDDSEAWARLSEQERTIASLTATDDFGRMVTLSGAEDGEKYVGMFFFLWHGSVGQPSAKIQDISNDYGGDYETFKAAVERGDIQAGGGKTDEPEPKDIPNDTVFWGKPIWDYYSQDDEWVVRKQIEMLTMAGVDFLFFDVTNFYFDVNMNKWGGLYEGAANVVLKVIAEYRKAGWDAPQAMFYTNTNDLDAVKTIYNTFYKNGRYGDAFFAPHGKPMIVMTAASRAELAKGAEGSLEKTVSDYFEFKNSVWPNSGEKTPDQNSFSWMEKYSDFGSYVVNRGGLVNISVAQHTNTWRFSDTDKNFGRGYDYETQRNVTENVRKGTNYQFLWDSVLKSEEKIDTVAITGWNEWIGGAFDHQGGVKVDPFTVDTFNEEYSRDLEPCYNGYGDNFYLQTAKNIRDFKYASQYKGVSDPVAGIEISDLRDQSVWDEMPMHYLDFEGECIERKHRGWLATSILRDTSNRNDIVRVIVTHDDENLYFRIETKESITAYEKGDTGWMNVLLSGGEGENLLGYRYVVNRTLDGNSSGVFERTADGWREIGKAEVYYQSYVMHISVPRSLFGLEGDAPQFTFKVCDNIKDPEDVLSYYNSGDAAPIGRWGYAYGF